MAVNPVKQAIIRACTDAAYRIRLLADPRKALAEEGIEVPPGIEVRIHENTDNKIIAVLPGPQAAELRDRTHGAPAGNPGTDWIICAHRQSLAVRCAGGHAQ